MKFVKRFACVGLALGTAWCPSHVYAGIRYVDRNASEPGVHDGSTWCLAFHTLNDALGAAAAGDTIRMANGVYVPDDTLPMDRAATFQLIEGITIEGGYAGCDAANPDARDPAASPTILSGDLEGDDGCAGQPTSNCCASRGSSFPCPPTDPSTIGCDDAVCQAAVFAANALCDGCSWHIGCVNTAVDVCGCLCVVGDQLDNSYHVVSFEPQIPVTGAVTTLDGLTISGGVADGPTLPLPSPQNPDQCGGGLYVVNGNIVLNNCIVRDNSAVSAGPEIALGGGIYAEGRSVTLTNCTIESNVAGIFQNGEYQFGKGGGVYLSESVLTLTGGTFDSNSSEFGGGIFSVFSDPSPSVAVSGTIFNANTASDAIGMGGAIQVTQGQANFTGCTFTNNAADRGGALAFVSSDGADISTCTFTQNLADDRGGAVVFDAACVHPTITGSGFDSNAAGGGGGVWIDGTSSAEVTSCDFGDNAASNNNGGGVGIINVDSATLSGCTFTGNSANSGGGLSVEYSGATEVKGCTFDQNTARSAGGGVFTQVSIVTIRSSVPGGSDSVFTWNRAQSTSGTGRGGGIMSASGQTATHSLTVEDTRIEFNFAPAGAGILTEKAGKLHIDRCVLRWNGTSSTIPTDITTNGGAVCFGGHLERDHTIRNSTITDNVANSGGGLYIGDEFPSVALIEDCTLANNTGGDGGAIYAGGESYATITRSRVVSNTATAGGGVYMWSPPDDANKSVKIRDSLIADNTASDVTSDGGGIWQQHGYLDLTNSTVANNVAGRHGGGLYGGNLLNATIQNSILWGNTAILGGQIATTADAGYSTTVASSDVEGGEQATAGDIYIINGTAVIVWDANNIEPPSPPLFTDPDGIDNDPTAWEDNDYRLQDLPTLSPCIDSGENSVIAQGEVDLDGAFRIVSCIVDMGAYEFQTDPPSWENPGDPGVVAVVGEAPVQIDFQVPVGSSYKLSFDPLLHLWEEADMTTQILPDTVRPGTSVQAGCGLDLLGYLGFQNCYTGPGLVAAPQECTFYDADQDTYVINPDWLAVAPTGAGPVCSTVTVYAEGIAASTALGDAPVSVLVDLNGTGSYQLSSTQPVTVASIDITPPSAGLGTELTITLTPAIPPLAFNEGTTATWNGVYQPSGGGTPTAPFQVSYNPQQFRESSLGQAVIVVGDGAVTNQPAMASLTGPGGLEGTITIALQGRVLTSQQDLGLNLGGATWEEVDDWTDLTPRIIGEPDTLTVMLLSTKPDPLSPSEELLLGANSFHFAAVVRIEGVDDQGTPCDDPPATIRVDLVSYDGAGLEIDRVSGLALIRLAEPDGDPNHFVYHNDLTKPIVFVDVDLDTTLYPGVIPFHVVGGGAAIIVAASE